MYKALLDAANQSVEPNVRRAFLALLCGLWELLACLLWAIGGIARKMWENRVMVAEFLLAAGAVTVLIVWLNLMAAIG